VSVATTFFAVFLPLLFVANDGVFWPLCLFIYLYSSVLFIRKQVLDIEPTQHRLDDQDSASSSRTSRSTATSTRSTSTMPRGNNNRNSQQNFEGRTTNPPSGQAPPPAWAPRVSDHGGQDSVGRTHQIDADHDMTLRLQ
jgi:hypothetical protein